MPEQYQRVEPTPFDAAPVSGAATAAAEETRRPALALPALAVLVVAALFVIFLLPKLIGDGKPDSAGATGAPATTAGSPGVAPAQRDSREAAAPATTPFADAVEARARAEAQELLGELIDVRENLSARGAESWAADAMAAIGAAAAAGDEHYRNREFDTAIASYRAALDEALALEGSLPERFAEQLARARAAIEALDPATAAQALDLARLIEPGDPDLGAAAARIEALPTVIEAVSGARETEAAGDLAAAVEALERAAGADPAHAYVAAELTRVRAALTEQRFSAAMSEGYAALDAGNFERAQARFERAAALRAGSDEAAAALQELGIARTAAQLAALQRRGAALAADENWEEAISVYEEALAIDGSLRFAREGLAEARPRAALVSALKAIIDQPGRLVDDAILREARGTLERAAGLANPGAKLAEQLATTREILRVASTPLPVRLRSDGATEVTVFKVARLGAFEEHNLELRPGEYTAVGRRRGFRDARVVFTVAPGNSEAIYIACTEAI